MKLSFMVGGAVGYVLGAKAGTERYEQIVAAARRFAGSQRVQATAGVVQAQLDTLRTQALHTVSAKVNGQPSVYNGNGANGHRRT